MSAAAGFERYVNLFRLRLKQLTAARGVAVMCVTGLAVSVIAVLLAIRSGFPDHLLIVARILLFGSLAAIFWYLIVRPNRRTTAHGGDAIERRTPKFEGRVETLLGMHDDDNPLRELLAEDTLAIAGRFPAEQQIRQREFAGPLALAAVALGALLFLAIAGPGNVAYGVRHLWAGWAVPGLLPPQSIAVLPGNDGIRVGGTVRVRAAMQGFSPRQATVHARIGAGQWQQVDMARREDGFEFTFFSVREPMEYYVAAASVRSQTYAVSVVDLPSIDSLTTTLRFPEWTGRDPEVHDPGGDVRAIADTEVELALKTNGPMPRSALILDGQQIPVVVDEDSGRADFTVEKDGQYHVAAIVGGEHIRLTDDFFVSVLDDEGPKIRFERPGRDWSASRIEEVTTRISAEDDFRIETLALRYSVNGAEWKSVELETDGDATVVDHVFFLESIDNDAGRSLVPGDLISYYALATDRENTVRTDIYFVDVQPFDRRYSQSQQSGGGQGGGQQQDEISQRQREIIVSTWNLIREQQNSKRTDRAYVPDNAALLSRLQNTLKEQAETLAARTRARQLTSADEQIAEFVAHLDKAAEAMVPASERLADLALEQAIMPEQEALQHLLRAEAVFTDISVTMQANNRGGGGGRAGRDLSEMFEIEMDLEKNQYESGSNATPDAPEQQLDEMRDELEALARRQEQLARNMRRSENPTAAQRWQQEMLRRNVEELRDRLERMQASNANAQSTEQSSGQSTGQSDGDSGQPNQPEDTASGEQPGELRRRLDSAIRAMHEADAAMRDGADRDSLERASAEAQRQLEGARDRAAAERSEAMQASLGELGNRAEDLHSRQAALEQKLQDSMRDILVGSNDLSRLDSGMSIDEEYEMAAAKRQLQKELQDLEQDTKRTSQRIGDADPQAAAQLDDAIKKLREQEVEARMAVSAAYIEQGEAVYVVGSESAITEALRELEQDLREAESMNGDAGGAAPRSGTSQSRLARTLADTRALRRALQDVTEGGATNGNVTNRGRDDLQRPSGLQVGDLDTTRGLERDLDNISEDAINLFRDLRAAGASDQDIDEIRRLAAEVRASDFSGNEAILEQESRRALSLVEQLELAIANAAGTRASGARSSAAADVPDDHKETVANYYRRLGEADAAEEER